RLGRPRRCRSLRLACRSRANLISTFDACAYGTGPGRELQGRVANHLDTRPRVPRRTLGSPGQRRLKDSLDHEWVRYSGSGAQGFDQLSATRSMLRPAAGSARSVDSSWLRQLDANPPVVRGWFLRP